MAVFLALLMTVSAFCPATSWADENGTNEPPKAETQTGVDAVQSEPDSGAPLDNQTDLGLGGDDSRNPSGDKPQRIEPDEGDKNEEDADAAHDEPGVSSFDSSADTALDQEASPPENPSGSFAPAAADSPIQAGTYLIRPASSLARVVDISGGSTSKGANIWLYQSNMTAAQQFTIAPVTTVTDRSGYYTIANAQSKMLLDVQGGRRASGTNVWQYPANQTDAQFWRITEAGKDANGVQLYTFVSALDNTLVLDVSGAEDANGANIQIYTSNGTAAQKFYLIDLAYQLPANPESASILPPGDYLISSGVGANLIIDVPGATDAQNKQLWVYARNDTPAQIFRVSYDKDGYATMQSLISGQYLSALADNRVATTPVVQRGTSGSSGSSGQKWVITKVGNSYTIAAANSGLLVDVKGATKASGTPLWLYTPNGTAAQSFTFIEAPEPLKLGTIVSLTPRGDTSKRVDITSASLEANAVAQLYASNNTLAQKFVVRAGSGNTFILENINSGLNLTDANGSITQIKATDATVSWTAEREPGGITFTNSATGRRLTAVGQTLKATSDALSRSQLFLVDEVPVINSGAYYTLLTPTGFAIDISGGSKASKANIQLYSANNTSAQKFKAALSGTWVILSGAASMKALDIQNGSAQNGANIWQYTRNNTSAQKWQFVPAGDGYFTVESALGTYLAAASDATGGNVFSTTTPSQALRVRLVATDFRYYMDNPALEHRLSTIMDRLGRDGNVLWKAFDHVSYYQYKVGPTRPDYDWVAPLAITMYDDSGGNCYGYAALFCALARYNGYEAYGVVGDVLIPNRGWYRHGWVEVVIDGVPYLFDPERAHADRSKSYYYLPYSMDPLYRVEVGRV